MMQRYITWVARTFNCLRNSIIVSPILPFYFPIKIGVFLLQYELICPKALLPSQTNKPEFMSNKKSTLNKTIESD